MTHDQSAPGADAPERAVTRTDEVAEMVAAVRAAHTAASAGGTVPEAPSPEPAPEPEPEPEPMAPVLVAVMPAPPAIPPVPPPPVRVRPGGSAVHLGPATASHLVVDVTADGVTLNGRPIPGVGEAEAVSLASTGAAVTGRLHRGPARRTRVFDRDIWRGAAARSSSPARDITEALTEAVHRYRQGAIDTTGLVRAIGHALAA